MHPRPRARRTLQRPRLCRSGHWTRCRLTRSLPPTRRTTRSSSSSRSSGCGRDTDPRRGLVGHASAQEIPTLRWIRRTCPSTGSLSRRRGELLTLRQMPDPGKVSRRPERPTSMCASRYSCGRAVPGRHRQSLPDPLGAIRPARNRLGAARAFGRATARPSGTPGRTHHCHMTVAQSCLMLTTVHPLLPAICSACSEPLV